MDEVKSTFEKHVEEVKQVFMDLKDKLMNIQGKFQEWISSAKDSGSGVGSTLMGYKDELESEVKDMSDVDSGAMTHMANVFSWLTITFVFYAASRVVGGYMQPVISIFLGGPLMVLCTYVLIPAYCVLYLKSSKPDEQTGRYFVLMSSIFLGLMVGTHFADKTILFYFPPAFFACFAVVLAALVIKQNPRQAFLGSSIGIAGGIFGFWGLLFGFSMGYFIWMILILALFAVDIQMKVHQSKQGWPVAASMMMTVVLFMWSYSIAYYVHGYLTEDIPKEY